jgi:hypothetical protein
LRALILKITVRRLKVFFKTLKRLHPKPPGGGSQLPPSARRSTPGTNLWAEIFTNGLNLPLRFSKRKFSGLKGSQFLKMGLKVCLDSSAIVKKYVLEGRITVISLSSARFSSIHSAMS